MDLKPHNIMLLPDSAVPGGVRVKLLDFGIARAPCDPQEPALTQSSLLGTPTYMSPEQCRSSHDVTDRSDVYSLGVVLYELICGDPPFSGEALQVLHAHVYLSAPALADRNRACPRVLIELVERMLAKNPRHRPSMMALSAKLDQLGAAHWSSSRSLQRWLGGSGMRVASSTRRMIQLILLMALLSSLAVTLRCTMRGARPPRPPTAGTGEVYLAGGRFTMGSTADEIAADYLWAKRTGCEECERVRLYDREQPLREVALSAYYIDATEVTNDAFARWLNSLHQQGRVSVDSYRRYVRNGETLLLDLFPDIGYNGIVFLNGQFVARRGMESRPVVVVTWDAARMYCRSRGKRLPTEAEWEFAARSEHRYRFPWGDDEPRCDGVIMERGTASRRCIAHGSSPADVATAPQDRTASGIYDLAGNAAEWVEDPFSLSYPACAADCRNPGAARGHESAPARTERVVRGGAWSRETQSTRAAGRTRYKQHELFADLGFRCARTAH